MSIAKRAAEKMFPAVVISGGGNVMGRLQEAEARRDADVRAAIPFIQAAIDEATEGLRGEVDRKDRLLDTASAIIEKLPVTADGVPVVPGMTVWWTAPVGIVNSMVRMVGEERLELPALCGSYQKPEITYSTREAAEKAKG